MKMITRKILIKGKVQGVFFRATAKKMADGLSLKGWVKNTKHGDVESVVTGDEDDIEKFIDWCRKGPEQAAVKMVTVSELPLTDYAEFSIIRGS